MTDNHNRQVAGQATGGQFAGRTHTESDVELSSLSDEEYNRSGTFLFPPRTRSAAQHMAFWDTCSIPDDVLENISLGYEKWAHDWQDTQIQKWLMDTYYKSVRIDPWKGNNNEISTAQIAAREAAAAAYAKAELDPIHPKLIDSVDARDVAKAGQLYYYGGDLTEEERTEVDASIINLRRGPMKVEDVVNKFMLTRIRVNFSGQTRAIVEGLDQIRVDVAKR